MPEALIVIGGRLSSLNCERILIYSLQISLFYKRGDEDNVNELLYSVERQPLHLLASKLWRVQEKDGEESAVRLHV